MHNKHTYTHFQANDGKNNSNFHICSQIMLSIRCHKLLLLYITDLAKKNYNSLFFGQFSFYYNLKDKSAITKHYFNSPLPFLNVEKVSSTCQKTAPAQTNTIASLRYAKYSLRWLILLFLMEDYKFGEVSLIWQC